MLYYYIIRFFKEYDYPQEARTQLLSIWDQLTQQDELSVSFFRSIEKFQNDEKQDIHEVFEQLSHLSKQLQVHEYSLHLLYLICISMHTKTLYVKEGLSERVFYDSISDFKIAMNECHMLYNVWGTHYGQWQFGFCNLSLIRFGRLEFGATHLWRSYESNITGLKQGKFVIEVHIPSGSKLDHEECMKSYAQAEVYYRKKYADLFMDQPIPFFVATWVLYAPMKDALIQHGNLEQFITDYTIIFQNDEPNEADLWRVFGPAYTNSIEAYPEDTKLQKNLKRWLLNGNHFGYGHGIMFFHNGKIVNV